jgi:hypothetical protein
LSCAGCALALAGTGCGEVIRLGDGPTAADGSTTTSGTPDGGACPTGLVSANEVVWIGDSYVQSPGTQVTTVEGLARATGAIGPNDSYVDLSVPGAVMSAIAGQYSAQEAGPIKIKVLIMDGGGFDLYLGNGSAATVTSVVSAFTQLLANVANDGTVQHVIYFLVPDASVPGVAALRAGVDGGPGIQQACAQSTVPCYFLDLQTIWAQHPEYTASNGVLASDAGGVAIGDAIWSIMQKNCIAQ